MRDRPDYICMEDERLAKLVTDEKISQRHKGNPIPVCKHPLTRED
ncbi:hypothetical protein [Bremerella sp.]